jgi:hypothetical protein
MSHSIKHHHGDSKNKPTPHRHLSPLKKREIPYGGLWYHVSMLTPLLIWVGVIIYTRAFSCRFCNALTYVAYVVLLAPFLLFFYNIYEIFFSPSSLYAREFGSGKERFGKAVVPSGWGFCYTTKVSGSHPLRPLATFNYVCDSQNDTFLKTRTNELLARAYNINYALLLLVFLLYNNMPSNILKDPRVAIFFVMSLILGSITAVMPLFTTTFDIYSVWLLQQFELLLDINISAFVMIILYLLEHAFFRKRGKPRKIKNMSFFDWLKGLF